MLMVDGIWVPLVTPFEHGAVDPPAFSHLVRHLAAQSLASFVACDSTGEAAMLDSTVQDAVLAAAAGKPVIMGLSGLSGVRPAAVAQRARSLAGLHSPAIRVSGRRRQAETFKARGAQCLARDRWQVLPRARTLRH